MPKKRQKKTKRARRKKTKANLRAPAKPSTKKLARRKKAKRRRTRVPGRGQTIAIAPFETKGLGARTGGQSGDTQGLSGFADVSSESVEELLEEGQAFEAEAVSGIENAPDADEEEVTTHEVPEDDVPKEYLDDK